jgi:hypothetical protein
MKWEYKTVRLSVPHFEKHEEELFEIDVALNQFGSEGWELIGTQHIDTVRFGDASTTNEIILFFKRLLPE